MSSDNCPCKGCVPPKRKPSCHGVCPEYIKWSRKHVADKIAAIRAKERDNIYEDYAIEEMFRNGKTLDKYR